MARSLTDTLDRLAASGKLDKFTSDRGLNDGSGQQIDLSSIEADPDQPRRVFDEDKLHSLSESIAAQGVLQPITVQPQNADGKHLIIMGERRWRAAQMVGLTRIPAIVREATAELRTIQLTENVQRADLTTMEIAQAVEQMRKEGKKRPEIAKSLGWSEAEVSRFAGILKMPKKLQDLARKNVPARALSDLNALWKKNERAVAEFVANTPSDDISRVTVAALRFEGDTGHRAPKADPVRQDGSDLRPPGLKRSSENTFPETELAAISAAHGAVAILCSCGGDVGRLLTDRRATSNKALLVSFDDGARIEEIALSEINLLEVIDA